MKKPWLIWLLVWIGIAAAGGTIGGMLWSQGATTAGLGVLIATVVLWAAWLAWGLWNKRRERWAKWAGVVLAGTVLDAGLFFLFIWLGRPGTAIGLAGVWVMAMAFLGGLALVRGLLLSWGWPVLGVARTLIDEAIRMKVALVFMAALVLLVPILPWVMDPHERLQYRIQSFLTYSLTASSWLLGLMTIFLACGTISNEIRQRQIFLTMTKPVSRAQYLLGKWLGIALLNLLLLSVSGGMTYILTRMLERQPALDATDRAAVESEVLVARETVQPSPPPGMNMTSLFAQRFRQLYADDPNNYGETGLDLSKTEVLQQAVDALTPRQRDAINAAVISRWQTLGPHDAQVYRFTGLNPSRQYGDWVQLRFKINATPSPPDERVHMWMKLNGQPYPIINGVQRPLVVPPSSSQVIDLPLAAADADGNLDVEFHNEDLLAPSQSFPMTINFDPGEGLSVLYRVGGFEANLVRGLAMIWLRLLFLASLGLAAATFLGFPVACLLSLMIYFSAIAKDFMLDSLSYFTAWVPKDATPWQSIAWVVEAIYHNLADGKFWEALKLPVRVLGQVFTWIVPSFGKFDPILLVSDGQMVSYNLLGEAALWVGLVAGGLCLLIGWFIFRKRELARVTV